MHAHFCRISVVILWSVNPRIAHHDLKAGAPKPPKIAYGASVKGVSKSKNGGIGWGLVFGGTLREKLGHVGSMLP